MDERLRESAKKIIQRHKEKEKFLKSRLLSIIREEIVKSNFHLPYNEGIKQIPTIFRAYRIQDNKIMITKKEDDDNDEHIFCNYLEDESEMNEFFNGISVYTFIMDNSTFGTHYSYGTNPIREFAKVSFDIYDKTIEKEIYFLDGMWYLPYEDVELDGVSYTDRDDIIRFTKSDERR
jgi:hypothetical protein